MIRINEPKGFLKAFFVVFLFLYFSDDSFVILQVHIKSRLILNGVCAKWRGWIDMDRLDGVGCVEFDEEAARVRIYTTCFCYIGKSWPLVFPSKIIQTPFCGREKDHKIPKEKPHEKI